MAKSYVKWGDWNACCDVCGLRFKASEMQLRWDGLMVCAKDWEPRHPQDYVRVRGDNVAVPWTRPEDDLFTNPVCYLWDIYAYAGLGVAGCMQAGKTAPLTSIQVWALKFPPPAA